MAETYSDLLIRIGPQDNTARAYPVEAMLADGSQFVGGELHLDLDRLSEEIRLDPAAYGLALFDALFAGPIRRAYDRALGRAAAETGGGVRVRLWIDDAASELHGLPWEGMYHAPAGQPVPLVVSPLTPFARYVVHPLPAPPPVPPPEKGHPVRMLFAVSSPSDLAEQFRFMALDVSRETARLRDSVGRLQQSGLLNIRVMPGHCGLSSRLREELEAEGYEIADGPITLSNLVREVGDCHVVHLMCHGVTSRPDNAAGLVLEDADGRARIARDQEFVQALALARQLPRLLFLASGDRPRGHGENPHVRLGKELVRSGIPAAIVMQDVITIEGASLATSAFYDSLLRHGYVDRALNEARLYLFNRDGGVGREWLMPVLFTRQETGQLISFEKESRPLLPDLQQDVQVTAVTKGLVGSAVTEDAEVLDLTRRFRHLAENLRRLHLLVNLANQLRQMREGFNPCIMIVQQAGADKQKIQVAPLSWVWQPLRDSGLRRLQLFLRQYSHLPVAEWFPPLLEQAELIDSSLGETNLGMLARSVTTFDRQLGEAEPYVRQQIDQAIAELVSYTDQMLGRVDTN